jgi:hypothetical protein
MRTNYKSALRVPRELAPGLFMWVPGTATFSEVELGGALYTVQMTLDATDEGVRPTSVTVSADKGGPPVTATVFRDVPVGQLTQHAIALAAMRGRRTRTKGTTEIDVLDSALTDEQAELLRLRGPTDESLEWAAYFYNLARLVGRPPAREVELSLGLPRTTASKWIRRAREKGLIDGQR